MNRRASRWWVAAAVGIALGACAEDAAPALTVDEYAQALASICLETADRLDALAPPAADVDVGSFASGVADALRDEAERARQLDPPAELDDDHRAFVQNTDDQAARWGELSTLPSSDAGFGEATKAIGELTLGRDDLATAMGVDACARADG